MDVLDKKPHGDPTKAVGSHAAFAAKLKEIEDFVDFISRLDTLGRDLASTGFLDKLEDLESYQVVPPEQDWDLSDIQLSCERLNRLGLLLLKCEALVLQGPPYLSTFIKHELELFVNLAIKYNARHEDAEDLIDIEKRLEMFRLSLPASLDATSSGVTEPLNRKASDGVAVTIPSQRCPKADTAATSQPAETTSKADPKPVRNPHFIDEEKAFQAPLITPDVANKLMQASTLPPRASSTRAEDGSDVDVRSRTSSWNEPMLLTPDTVESAATRQHQKPFTRGSGAANSNSYHPKPSTAWDSFGPPTYTFPGSYTGDDPPPTPSWPMDHRSSSNLFSGIQEREKSTPQLFRDGNDHVTSNQPSLDSRPSLTWADTYRKMATSYGYISDATPTAKVASPNVKIEQTVGTLNENASMLHPATTKSQGSEQAKFKAPPSRRLLRPGYEEEAEETHAMTTAGVDDNKNTSSITAAGTLGTLHSEKPINTPVPKDGVLGWGGDRLGDTSAKTSSVALDLTGLSRVATEQSSSGWNTTPEPLQRLRDSWGIPRYGNNESGQDNGSSGYGGWRHSGPSGDQACRNVGEPDDGTRAASAPQTVDDSWTRVFSSEGIQTSFPNGGSVQWDNDGPRAGNDDSWNAWAGEENHESAQESVHLKDWCTENPKPTPTASDDSAVLGPNSLEAQRLAVEDEHGWKTTATTLGIRMERAKAGREAPKAGLQNLSQTSRYDALPGDEAVAFVLSDDKRSFERARAQQSHLRACQKQWAENEKRRVGQLNYQRGQLITKDEEALKCQVGSASGQVKPVANAKSTTQAGDKVRDRIKAATEAYVRLLTIPNGLGEQAQMKWCYDHCTERRLPFEVFLTIAKKGKELAAERMASQTRDQNMVKSAPLNEADDLKGNVIEEDDGLAEVVGVVCNFDGGSGNRIIACEEKGAEC